MSDNTMAYRPVTPAVANALADIVGAPFVFYDDPERLEAFSHDEVPGLGHRRRPEAAVRPGSAAEIAAIVKLANRERIPVTPRGAGSGLSGGAVPVHGGIVIATDRLNRILEIDRDNLTVTVEPGVVANDINEALSDSGLFYAGYPMSLETCFIGGNLAENAGGGKAIKYGVTSRYVLGLEVVTPTGDLVMLGGKLQKDVTGYNLLQLMIGSEGTLGIFTKAILKLIPRPRYQVDLLCLFPDSTTAIQTVPALLTASGITPTSIEYMDRKAIQASCDYLNESIPYENCGAMLLISIDGIDEAQLEHDYEIIGKFCQEHGAGEIYVADNPSTSERIWKIRRNIAEAYNVRFKRQSCEDIVVPPAAIAAIVQAIDAIGEKYQVSIPCYGHAGDGNLHCTVCGREEWSEAEFEARLREILAEIYAETVRFGGKISGEHGIGSKRIGYMASTVRPEYLTLMRTIKQALDPNHIMNPGKIFELT